MENLKNPSSYVSEPNKDDDETRREKLKSLIKQGKTSGYLTSVEIRNHFILESNDVSEYESVVSLFADMGISVYEAASLTDSEFISNSDAISEEVKNLHTENEVKKIKFKRVHSDSFGESGTDYLLNPSILSNIATGVNERKEKERVELERAITIQERMLAQARKKVEALRAQKNQLWAAAELEYKKIEAEIYKAAFSGRNSVHVKVPVNVSSRVVELLNKSGVKASSVTKNNTFIGTLPDLEILYSGIETLLQAFETVDNELNSHHLSGNNSTSVSKDIYQLLDEAEEKIDDENSDLEGRNISIEEGIYSEEIIISDALAYITSLIETSRQSSQGNYSVNVFLNFSSEKFAELFQHLRILKKYLFSFERDLLITDSASGVLHVRETIKTTTGIAKKIENIEVLLKKISSHDPESIQIKVNWHPKELIEFTVDESISIVSWLITNGGQGLCRNLVNKIHESAGAGNYNVIFEISQTGFHRSHWGNNGCLKVAFEGKSLGIFPGNSEFLLRIFRKLGFKTELYYKEELRLLSVHWI